MRPCAVGLLCLAACGPGVVSPGDPFAPTVVTKSLAGRLPSSNVMVVLDTSAAMGAVIEHCKFDCPTQLTAVAEGLADVVGARGSELRFGLTALGPDCGAGTQRVALPDSVRDEKSALEAKAGEVKLSLAGLTAAGSRSIAATLANIGDVPNAQMRQQFVLLVTSGLDTCGGDPEAAVKALRARGIRTLVAATAPNPALDQLALLNGIQQRALPAPNREALRTALLELTDPGLPSDGLCRLHLDATPPVLSVFADGKAVAPDEPGGGWTYASGVVELKGSFCSRAREATPQEPLFVEVHVPAGF